MLRGANINALSNMIDTVLDLAVWNAHPEIGQLPERWRRLEYERQQRQFFTALGITKKTFCAYKVWLQKWRI